MPLSTNAYSNYFAPNSTNTEIQVVLYLKVVDCDCS